MDTRITAVDLISKVTEAVNEELAAWRNWPLDRICPV
jgi:transposase-like protein